MVVGGLLRAAWGDLRTAYVRVCVYVRERMWSIKPIICPI